MSKFAAPRKSLGQNFLQDPNIINKIVASLGITKNDAVVEIGPGRGALTDLIIPRAGHTHLIEFDRDLVVYWRDRASSMKNLTVHGVDVMRFDLHEIISTSARKIKVIGNLPYNISSPVLFHLMHYAEYIEHQVVMLQKEVVERMASGPGSRQYGRLSVMLQQRYHIENLFKVPPTAFFPAPKVDSAIARLTPLTTIPFPVDNQADFEKTVKQAFSMRRKTLRNNLKGSINSEQIESLNINPGARAETLGVADFAALSNLYTKLPKTA
ncbi:MAG: 16S rRNA (adenine1518-N6/adenine1519-N6)-dimethyltransferase [Arenicella sp.]|jgi:16S rRNA (adenine1518-N6/adenine1519-N6)-dimethyltransferase